MTLVQPVIMAGGSGTRLWPLSRATYPKQFLALSGAQDDRRSLFQHAVARLARLAHGKAERAGEGLTLAAPLIVGNEEHRFLMLDQLQEMKAASGGVLLEPTGRNTAPAVTLAALHATQGGADPMLVDPRFRHAPALRVVCRVPDGRTFARPPWRPDARGCGTALRS